MASIGAPPASGAASLDRLMTPRSVALVGASERSIWSTSAHDNLARFGYAGKIHPINPKGGVIHGVPAATSCAAVGEPIDAALVMVPEAALLDTFADLEAAGVGGAVVLSAGFAETGEDGARRQRAAADAARAAGIRLVGPNCLGFANYVDQTVLWTTPLRRGLPDPQIAVVSQSGALAGQLEQFCYQQRAGLTHLVSTGNEADVTVADVIAHLATRPEPRAIAVFLEMVRDPGAFMQAIAAANAADKPVIVLKVGASEAAAAAAQAHTGSLVGDDRLFDALCERMAMTRVNSLEELIVTADIFARVGPVAGEGPAMVALSGGLCEIAIDQAEAEGVPLAPLADKTKAELRAKLPAMIRPGNPLDVTGAAMREPALIATALSELSKDPSVGLVTFNFDIPPREDKRGFTRGFVSAVGAGFAQSDKPCLMFSHTASSVSGDARALAAAAGVPYSGGGLTFGLRAIGRLFRWSAARGRASAPAASRPETSVRPRSEHEVLDHLKAYGVGVVPALIARSADEAAAHARAHGREVALKIASPDIAHKTEVGGVALGLRGEEAVRAAYERVTRSVADARPDAAIDGVIVAPMRQGGVELFVGVMRDPQWGPSIAVGLGGILVEALRDTSLRLLPITSADALAMLSELRGEALLDGFRGAPAVDRAAAAETIVAVGEAALALGPDLISLEVNPLLAAGTRIEALDGLALWSKPA